MSTNHAYPCPACGEGIDLDITWRQDSDGDGPYTRSWWYPDLVSPAICLACGAEADADTIGRWLDDIAAQGVPPPDEPPDWPDDLPF